MKEDVLIVRIDGPKLWVTGALAGGENQEHYLPDTTEELITEFLTPHIKEVAEGLNRERPWRTKEISYTRPT